MTGARPTPPKRERGHYKGPGDRCHPTKELVRSLQREAEGFHAHPLESGERVIKGCGLTGATATLRDYFDKTL